MHLTTVPGQQGQVDFGDVGKLYDPVTNKHRRVYVFVMTLSHSRLRFIFRQDTMTWIDCHIRAFHFFCGVPKTIILDNLKAGVISPDLYDPVLNRAYAECERHYGFVADPAKVRTPEHKGKVERSIMIVRQQLIAGMTYKDIVEANEQALHWCRYEISQRVTRTTGETPWERFERAEKPKLQPLPASDFENPIWSKVMVHKDQHVVFEGSFYSVSYRYLNQSIWLRATSNRVELYSGWVCIKTNQRAKCKGEWITDKEDYPDAIKKYIEATPEHCIREAHILGPYIGQIIEKLLKRPSNTKIRKTLAILRLAENYSSSRLNHACCRAINYGNDDYQSIERILEKGLDYLAANDQITEEKAQSIEWEDEAFLRDSCEFMATENKES